MSKYDFRTLAAHNIEGVSTYRNYIRNNSGEKNTGGWATYADVAGERPTGATGGSPTVTWAKNNNPYFGSATFSFNKGVGNKQGQGVSYQFTIDSCDTNKVFNIEFDYKQDNGLFESSNDNVIPSDLCVYIIDTTASALIEPSIRILDGGNSATNTYKASFQTSTNIGYRLAIHVATTNTNDYLMYFDNFKVTPADIPLSDNTVASRVVLSANQSIPNATATKVTLDTVRIDTNGGFDTGNNRYIVQMSGEYEISAKAQFVTNGTGIRIAYLYKNGGVFSEWPWPSTAANNTTAFFSIIDNAVAGDYYEFYVFQDSGGSLDIVGISSNDYSQMMVEKLGGSTYNDNNRIIAFRASQDSNQSIPDATFTTVIWNLSTFDSSNSYNSSTGEWTCPQSGKYRINVSTLATSETWNTNTAWSSYIFVNGVAYSFIGETRAQTNTTSNFSSSGGDLVDLVAGDIVEIKIFQNRGAATTLFNTADPNYINIDRISAPSLNTPVETVALRATASSSAAIPDTATTFVFDLVTFDTHNTYNDITGEYIVPISGLYKIESTLPVNSSLVNAFIISVRVNGSVYKTLSFPQQAVGSFDTPVYISTLANLVAGDTVDIRIHEAVNNGVFSLSQELIIQRTGL